MATFANKNNINSCSSIPSRPTNPSRSSEVSNPMRRSFSGNPFVKPSIIANQRPGFNPNTPANSPSDYPRRCSSGRENIIVTLRDTEDKENGKDHCLKPASIRSPASSKGAKNFMSPTISAASKITPSPRKKILTERNEAIRSSVQFPESKSPFKEDLDRKPDKGLNQKEVSFDPVITYLEDSEDLKNEENCDSLLCSTTKDGVDSSLQSCDLGSDCVNLDPSFNISPSTSCPLPYSGLAPLDADPSMPPYDPKTNYLSPRPRFLHYKPNPRIEQYLNKERDGKQLDEIFASESSSDSEVIEQETESDDSRKESEDSSSSVVVKQEEDEVGENEEEDEELPVSELNPVVKTEVDVTAKRLCKPNLFTKTKLSALLFVLAIACLWSSVSNSPVMDPLVLNNLSLESLYVPPEIAEFTRDNLEILAQRVRQWLYDWLSYIHNLIISFRDQHKPGPLQFANLTSLIEDGLVDNDFLLVAHSSSFAYEINEVGPKSEAEVDIKSPEEAQLIDADEDIEEVGVDEALEVVEDIDEADKTIMDEEFGADYDKFHVSQPEFKEVIVNSPTGATEPGSSATEVSHEIAETASEVIIDQTVQALQAVEIQSEVADSRHVLAKTEIAEAENELRDVDKEAALESSQGTEPMELKLDGNKNLLPAKAITGILLLLAAAAFIYAKNQTSSTLKAAAADKKMPLMKKHDDNSPLSMTTGHIIPPSRTLQTEVETIGESCPTEMSSFQYSRLSSYEKAGQKGLATEAQSQERKLKRSTRRESMASSDCSMGSPSYGSFTTYENLANQHGNSETPVRRSSRIRNKVTSP